MNHDEIRAALAAATPGPWQVYESMQADTFVYGPRGILRDDIIAGPTYNRENAHLIANAPTWLAELLGEVDLLTARAEAAVQVVQRVRELHAPMQHGPKGQQTICVHCFARYPCTTIGALDGGDS